MCLTLSHKMRTSKYLTTRWLISNKTQNFIFPYFAQHARKKASHSRALFTITCHFLKVSFSLCSSFDLHMPSSIHSMHRNRCNTYCWTFFIPLLLSSYHYVNLLHTRHEHSFSLTNVIRNRVCQSLEALG